MTKNDPAQDGSGAKIEKAQLRVVKDGHTDDIWVGPEGNESRPH